MPRNISGVMNKVPGTTAVTGELIEASKYNATIDDIINDLNQPRPVTAGGTGVTTIPDLKTALGIMTDLPRVDVASAATVNLAAATSRYVNLTGTTTITSFGTGGTVGARYLVRVDGILTLTNSASLVCLTGANIITEAGDTFEMVLEAGNVWRMTDYQRASGRALAVATVTGNYVPIDSATGAATMPVGTTAQRPATPATGMFRMNTTTGEPEWYNVLTAQWVSFVPANSGILPGEIVCLAQSTAPTGMLKCNGALVSRTTYSALFTAISTTFGARIWEHECDSV